MWKPTTSRDVWLWSRDPQRFAVCGKRGSKSLQYLSPITCNSLCVLGVVLGSFYYGYVALQIPGGWLALKVGGTRLFGLAVLIASALTLLTPVASRTSVVLLIIVRVGEGLVLVSLQLLWYVISSHASTSANTVILISRWKRPWRRHKHKHEDPRFSFFLCVRLSQQVKPKYLSGITQR